MAEEIGKEIASSNSAGKQMSTARRAALVIVLLATAICAAISYRLFTSQAAGPSQQAMGGPILAAVAVFLPTLWLIFLSTFSPGIRLLGATAICAMTAVSMQLGEPVEQALCNILTLAFSSIALACFLVWILIFGSSRAHWRTLLAIGAAVVLFFVFFRLEEPTGNMVPRVRFRFSKRPDQLLEKLPSKAVTEVVDLTTTVENDFPGFLGADRDGVVKTGIRLSTDWEKNPPKLLWKQPIGAGWSAFAIVNGHAVTLEQRDTEELVTCYNLKTGKLEWSHGIAARHESALGGIGPRSTPTIHNGRVYALGATGVLQCLNGADGTLVWSRDLLKDRKITPAQEAKNIAWGRAASPLIVDEMVIVPAGGPDAEHCVSLLALNAATGDVLWQGGSSQVSYCSPQIADLGAMRQILIINEATVAGHDPATGKQLWEFPWPGESNAAASNSQAHVLNGDRVLITKGYGTGGALYQISREGDRWSVASDPIWQNRRVLKTKFSNVVFPDEDRVLGLSEGVLECVNAETGERIWRGDRYGHGQVLLVGDSLLVLGEAGELAIGKAMDDAWTELGRIQALEGKTWNNPALAGNLLLVRNAEEAACYELAVENQ